MGKKIRIYMLLLFVLYSVVLLKLFLFPQERNNGDSVYLFVKESPDLVEYVGARSIVEGKVQAIVTGTYSHNKSKEINSLSLWINSKYAGDYLFFNNKKYVLGDVFKIQTSKGEIGGKIVKIN